MSTLPIQNEYELVGSATYGRVVVYSKRAWVCKTRQGNNEHDADGEQQHKPDSYDSQGLSQYSRGFGIPFPSDRRRRTINRERTRRHERVAITNHEQSELKQRKKTSERHVEGLDPI